MFECVLFVKFIYYNCLYEVLDQNEDFHPPIISAYAKNPENI